MSIGFSRRLDVTTPIEVIGFPAAMEACVEAERLSFEIKKHRNYRGYLGDGFQAGIFGPQCQQAEHDQLHL